ncbi:C6 zinc finger domain-containing protein, partial [Colletotrichum scovillei]
SLASSIIVNGGKNHASPDTDLPSTHLHTMVNNRLGHSKSRLGCIRCKKRHVKCDEKRPCSSCVKHEVLCSLVSTTASLQDPERGSSGSPRTREQPSIQQTKFIRIRNLIQSLSGEIDLLDEDKNITSQTKDDSICHEQYLQDLRLMHHFTISAALTVADDHSLREAWQITIPELSFSCDGLRHDILAFSALHRGHLFPKEKELWSAAAQRHLDAAAVTQIRSSSRGTIEDADCYFVHTLLKFSIETYRIAQSPQPVNLSNVLLSFTPLQELRSILLSDVGQGLGKGALASLFDTGIEHLPPLSEELELTSQLSQLEKLCRGDTGLKVTVEVSKVCLAALEILDMTCRSMVTPLKNRGVIWCWPFFFPSDFLHLLSSGEPFSCVLLVHYAALVRVMEDDFWYCQGWSSKICSLVGRILLDPWKVWIEWPLKCVEQGIDIRYIHKV